MRKAYSAALQEVFSVGLAQACPEFAFVRKHAPFVGVPGERAYCWKRSETLLLWIVLIPDQKREAFFVELGWSRHGRFPQLTMRPSGIDPSDAGTQDEYVCRLGALSRRSDFGWSIEELSPEATREEMLAYLIAQTEPVSPELARARVAPRVEEALGELNQFGLPFLLKQT